MLWRTAAAQFGAVNWSQIQAAGFDADWVKRQKAGGLLTRELPRVYCPAGVPHSWERDLMGIHLSLGDGSAASHRSAAALLGLDGFPKIFLELSTTKRINSPRKGVILHRVDGTLIREITHLGPIPVTSHRRTLLDLAALGHPRTESALDECLRKRYTALGAIWLLLDHPRTWGRRGTKRLRDLLIPRTKGMAPTDSELELLGLRVLKRGGLPSPCTQHPVTIDDHVIHCDLAFPEALLAIELDSHAWHSDGTAVETDRTRDLELGLRGWMVLRFTWAMLNYDPAFVVSTVRFHLENRLPHVSAL